MSTKLKQILKVLAIITALLVALFYATVYYIFSGGFSGILSSLKPAPDHNSNAIIKKRAVIESEITETFSDIENSFELKHHKTAIHDECYKGSHGYKRSDSYAYKCTYRITKFYGLDGNFLQNAIHLEEAITTKGWFPPVYEDPFPFKKIADNIQKYKRLEISSLYGYEKNDGLLYLFTAQKDSKNTTQLQTVQEISNDTYYETFEEKNFVDADLIFEEITTNAETIVAIAIQKDYFQN